MPKWKTVSIRRELINEIERILTTGRYGSISEFVSEAIRLRLEEIIRAEGLPVEKRHEGLATPAQLLYTPKHTWAQLIPDGNVRVGISDYAQKHLRGIAHIRTEPVGKEVNKMERFGVAETWMFTLDLFSPVSGRIAKVNVNLKDDPHIINEDPYSQGWIVEIKPNNSLVLEQELKSLLSAREYSEMLIKLEGRLHE
jgi:glycine cleavage system H protein